MNFAFSSPLKAIQGFAIKDLTAIPFGPHKFGRSSSPPRERPSDLSHPPPTSLRLSTVSIPTKAKYIPKQRPPPDVHSSRPDDTVGLNKKSPKIILSRFLLVNGSISFLLGTQVDGVVTRDAEEVPLAKILEHVSPAELERFENQDFFDEDERERLLPPKKPRGRPRRDDTTVPSFSIAPVGEETSREHSLLPERRTLTKAKLGRPKGSVRKAVDGHMSKKLSVVVGPSNAIKRPRGRPPLQKKLSVVVPSFNGPQPQEPETDSSAQSESDVMLEDPKPQYSMITASGLGRLDTEDVTSRDQSAELKPSSKRRRLDEKLAFIDLSADSSDNDERASRPVKRTKTFPETSPDPIADDSIALLRQFQARVYAPNQSEKTNSIPHRQRKPSQSLIDVHVRPSSLSSSSSDLSMGPAPQPLNPLPNPLPTQNAASEPLPQRSSFQQRPPKEILNAPPVSNIHSNITVSHPPRGHPAKTPPTRRRSPSKAISRRVSLTPHFPPNTSFDHSESTKSSAKDRSHSSTPPPSRREHSKQSNTRPPETIQTQPSLGKQVKPSGTPQIKPSQPSKASATSKIGFINLPRAKSITDYFTTKIPARKPTQPPQPPPPLPSRKIPHSPAAQLLGAQEANNHGATDSEDQLARTSSTDDDSINSEIMVVRPKYPSVPANNNNNNNNNNHNHHHHPVPAAPAPMSREPSHCNHVRTNPPKSSSSSTYISQSNRGQTRHPSSATLRPTNIYSKTATPSRAIVVEDDDDDDENNDDGNPDSHSDSLGSEVMVVRAS